MYVVENENDHATMKYAKTNLIIPRRSAGPRNETRKELVVTVELSMVMLRTCKAAACGVLNDVELRTPWC